MSDPKTITKKRPLLQAYTIGEVTDILIESMRDHDTGWAYVTEVSEGIVEFVVPQYNRVQKKFKITIEEA